MPVKLENISSIAPNSTGQIEVTSDLNLIGTSPVPVYRVNGVPISTGGGSSQWTDIAGGGIYYSGGNVGIGTATPLHPLDTACPVRIRTGSPAAGIWLDGAATPQIVFIGMEATSDSLLRIYSPAMGNIFTVDLPSGNVGIGTTSPSSRLVVCADGSNINNQLNLRPADGNNAYGLGIGYTILNGDWRGTLQVLADNLAYPLVLNPWGGNVGINASNPAGRLQVEQPPGGNFNLYLSQSNGSWFTANDFNNYRFIQTASAATDGNFKYLAVGAGGVGIGWAPPTYGSADALYVIGNVGIATNSPQYNLDVGGAGSGATSRLGAMAMLRADAGNEWNLGNFTDNSGSWQLTRRNITTNAWNNAITVDPSGGTSIGTYTVGDQLNIVGFGKSGYGQLRIVEGPYGSFWRQDSASLYLMTTNVNDPWGTWKGPFAFQVDLGSNTIGICASPNPSYGLSVGGNLNITGGYYVNGVPLATHIGPTNHQEGNRALNTVYQNNTGKPLWVLILGGGNGWLLRSDQGNPPTAIMGAFLPTGFSVTILVLPGWYYMLDTQSLPGALNYWHEWW